MGKPEPVWVLFVGCVTIGIILLKPRKGRLPPQAPGWPWIGSFFEVLSFGARGQMHLFFDKMQETLGDYAMWTVLGQRFCWISDPVDAKRVLTSTEDFVRGQRTQMATSGFASMGLFALPTGSVWSAHRKALLRAWTPAHLRFAFDKTIESTQKLLTMYKTVAFENMQVDMYRHMTALSADIIGHSAFSYDFGGLDSLTDPDIDSDALKRMDRIVTLIQKRITLSTWLWPLLGLTNAAVADDLVALKSLFERIIRDKEGKQPRGDLLDCLLAVNAESQERVFSDEEIMHEIFAFYLAGHETTANTITFVMWELGQNSVLLARLYTEIADVLGPLNGVPSWDSLQKMPFLEACIKEAQRLHPVVGGLGRLAVHDIAMGSFIIPKGTVCFTGIRSFQRDPRWWGADAMMYNPNRWMHSREVTRAFMPFGDGPHNCTRNRCRDLSPGLTLAAVGIGQKMAMMEMKTILSMILYRFSVTVLPGQTVEPVQSFTYGLKGGLTVSLKPY